MSEVIDAAIAAMEARMAMQDARIRATHESLQSLAAHVDTLREKIDRHDREMGDASDAMDDIMGDLSDLKRRLP